MRAQRQKVRLLQQAGANTDEITTERCKYQYKLDEYKTFSKKMGLQTQMERVYYDLEGRVAPSKDTYRKWLADIERKKKDDIIKSEIKKAGIRGTVKIMPSPMDVSGYDFDENHINAERKHLVSRKEAEKYIKEADVSVTRWNGRFINYYSPAGAVFLDTENHLIRTAFKEEEFDDHVRALGEVLRKYGIRKD